MKYLPFLFVVILSACTSYKNMPLNSSADLLPPPGTTEISENLFFDQTEVTNFHWLEYSYWLKRVFGEDSEEFKSSIPNKEAHEEAYGLNISTNSLDLKHPAYRDYPVVGISYQQALDYSQWRSDRVMENFLVKKGILSLPHSDHKDSIFTIRKYFTGQYLNIQPNPEIQYYPEYSLPNHETFKKSSQFVDSLYADFIETSKGKKHATTNDVNCLDQTSDSTPIRPSSVNSQVYNKKLKIHHLKGNVREMTATKGEFFGLSFMDSCDLDDTKIRRDDNLVNSYTGFRNVCIYLKWEDGFE
ncbi:SUMF1/EgtB/PvdO family nonheme iron enzyme [Brumimicrobium oceani]|nr:SUMF1/EgtB/PvdO family nonheme iron enzyme [Brumimicrobium oceani]